ncbi:hypothetical protein DB313_06155 (plasmid) [Borrelia turcica IST7]|uniref:Outer surface lipoprotein BB0158 domain-containing protein n=1 Tax=Borrelia turcica IST7 TaxID=1104446 RepID=A0A386PNN2_9SPIR|nr:hypothetical protein [Borrelia turcica]AYE37081.1 hypothetical protein DB313_06155 [Borrelia turcica IST7]
MRNLTLFFILSALLACDLAKDEIAHLEEESDVPVVSGSTVATATVKSAGGVSFEVVEGKLQRCLLPHHRWFRTCTTCFVSWIKIKPLAITKSNGKLSKTFKNRLGYSFSILPLKYNDGGSYGDSHNSYIMPQIVFENLDSSNSLEVLSFKLTDFPQLNFNKKGGTFDLPRVEKSPANPNQDVYPFGILSVTSPSGGDEVISAIEKQFKGGKWGSLRAKITVKEKGSSSAKTYNITLDTGLFNEFMKQVFARYPKANQYNKKFRIPVAD